MGRALEGPYQEEAAAGREDEVAVMTSTTNDVIILSLDSGNRDLDGCREANLLCLYYLYFLVLLGYIFALTS